MRLALTLTILLTVCFPARVSADDRGQFARWSKIELSFAGPDSQGRGEPNPFSVQFDVQFISPGGVQFQVPGFYDGDGQRGLNGDVWKVRFSADELGAWEFKTNSDNRILDEITGRFVVTKTPDTAHGFWKWGRLDSVGTAENRIRYLKFRDGPYFLKAGCDDPENFLGRYEHYNTLAKRKAAVDYLAQRGINSCYIMTHNIGGDDKDVWPWLGRTQQKAMSNGAGDPRFDVAKLDEWRELFEHMQTRGVVPYLVLEDDSAWKDYDHDRYYREIIARFGYLPALMFNCGEEHNENYRLRQALQFMSQLQQIDPYDHPRGIHNINRPNVDYVDASQIDFTSIQTGSPGSRSGLSAAMEHNQIALDWISLCQKRGRRVLVANFDEGRPEHDRRAWWGAYVGGGVWEAHVLPEYDRPMSAWETIWNELGGARAFMETLPFAQMHPQNNLVTEGQAVCLARIGEAYACYLPVGGRIQVQLAAGADYDVAWWNPGNDFHGSLTTKSTCRGGTQWFEAPTSGDWALRIVKRN
ncbi:MAG: DUF5060 domain-containing protein [Fuerstiella sp.]|nr:DUF5060 domain-containing protein [Fuerstiella sp.]